MVAKAVFIYMSRVVRRLQRMKKAIIFISIALVLVLIISFFALYMIGDRILNQLIDSEVARIDAMVEDEIDSFGSNNDAPEGQLDDSRKEPPKKEGQKEDTEKSTNISGDSQKGEKEPVAQEQRSGRLQYLQKK